MMYKDRFTRPTLWALSIVAIGAAACSSGEQDAKPPSGSQGDGSADVVDASTDQVAADAPGDSSLPDASCFPATCGSLSANCGTTTDGCGGTIDCGSCDDGMVCGGDGPNRCGEGKCLPKTCDELGADCGLASDGCSRVVNCGGCPPPSVCGGIGAANQCECIATTCEQSGAECGTLPDGCGGVIDCGSCSAGDTCGGGGANRCGTGACSPKTCMQIGASCGWVSDGCSTAIACGDCEAPNTCGGGGESNECGCLAKSCAQLGASCGTLDTGCGAVNCGTCNAPDTCGGGGISNVCGCTCSLPNAITSCEAGVCKILDCSDGWGDCNAAASDGCESNLGSSLNHCGACGNACSFPNASALCSGQCQMAACNPNYGNCDGILSNGCETNTLSDASNCGACGNACSLPNTSQSTCSSGSCKVGTCSSGWVDCDGIPSNGCECGGNKYCYAGKCHDLPTMTWTPTCMDGGVPHSAPNYLFDFKIYGRPGASAQKFNRHVSCGTPASFAETWVIPASGWVGEVFESSPIGCFETIGEWETWAIVDGHETNRLFVTFYSSLCSGASTCTQAKSYCWSG